MRQKMTIMIITPYMKVGGAEKYFIQKTEWLVQNNYRVVLISGGGEWAGKINEVGGIHYKMDMINKDPFILHKKKLLQTISNFSEIFENEKVSIIETTQLTPAFWGYHLSINYNVPFFINVLASPIFYKGQKTYLRFLQYLDEHCLYYNSECSNSIIEQTRNIKLNNCKEIPIPIKTNRILNDANISKNNSDYILSVTRMTSEKMYIKYLINDFYDFVIENQANTDLIIVGDGPLFNEVQELAVSLNKKLINYRSNIILKGTVTGNDLEILFSNCLFYVGMGTTVLQASSYKKASILASPEKKHMNKSPGFFGDDIGLSLGYKMSGMKLDTFNSRMTDLIKDKSKSTYLGDRAFELINDVFSIDSVFKKWEKEYDHLIDRFEKNKCTFFKKNHLFYSLKKIKDIFGGEK